MNDQNLLVLLDERVKEIARALFQECLTNVPAATSAADDASASLREQLTESLGTRHGKRSSAALVLFRDSIFGSSWQEQGKTIACRI